MYDLPSGKPKPFVSPKSPPDPEEAGSIVAVEFPVEFWHAIQGLAEKGGVTPESVICAGTSLYALALKAKSEHQKLALIERDQECITEIKGI